MGKPVEFNRGVRVSHRIGARRSCRRGADYGKYDVGIYGAVFQKNIRRCISENWVIVTLMNLVGALFVAYFSDMLSD